jgi:hypothetical protein
LIGNGCIARYQRRSTPVTKACFHVVLVSLCVRLLPAPRRCADPPSLECWPSNHAGRLACAAAYYDARAPCFASCRPCSDERTPSSSSSPAPTLLRRRSSAPHVHSQGLKLCHFWAGTLDDTSTLQRARSAGSTDPPSLLQSYPAALSCSVRNFTPRSNASARKAVPLFGHSNLLQASYSQSHVHDLTDSQIAVIEAPPLGELFPTCER